MLSGIDTPRIKRVEMQAALADTHKPTPMEIRRDDNHEAKKSRNLEPK